MLTRLKVSSFKNLVDVDIRFGPFTCVAGSNGVGKSNLFDAIGFLSALAEMPLTEAAKSIRDGRTLDVANLFHRVGFRRDETMTFEAEMIIPGSGADDLGQEAEASITFLRYSLELGIQQPGRSASYGSLALRKESLVYINVNDSTRSLLFPHSEGWRKSAVYGRRTVAFISTDDSSGDPDDAVIHLHQDRGKSGGRPAKFRASTLPRTVLSSVNAAENRTAVLARREMQSWRRLQLEPAALREPDTFTPIARLGSNGSHLAATLYHLAHDGVAPLGSPLERVDGPDPITIYTRVANRLAGLIEDVREVGVDEDQQRELWTLFALGNDGTKHPARALSDGTLRFLALAVIELDPAAQGVLCLEEPENGIHPACIPAMLKLLKDIAVDTDEPIGPDNPLRQVIINTHSPAVVSEVDDDSLVVAKLGETVRDGERFPSVQFLSLSETWRSPAGDESANGVPKGDVLVYLEGPRSTLAPDLEPLSPLPENGHANFVQPPRRRRRVIDRDDMQKLLNFGDDPT